MHCENNAPAPMSPHYVLGLLAGGSGAELVDIEPRGEGLVARIEIGGTTFRVQLDAMVGA